jgi:aspartate kinase
MKFGGTSVGTPAAMAQAAEIAGKALPTWPRLVVVTSALSGVTNLLLESATCAARGDLQTMFQAEGRLRQAHEAVIAGLIGEGARCYQIRQDMDHLIGDFVNLCRAIAVLGEASPRALDAVAALGERMSVRLLAAALQEKDIPAQFVEATQLIVTDSNFTNAHPDLEATRQRTRQVLEPLLAQGRVPVVTGFIAADVSGITTTLGRGGSDYSAALLGAALPADEVWIWSDVDGVMSADPRPVPPTARSRELPTGDR